VTATETGTLGGGWHQVFVTNGRGNTALWLDGAVLDATKDVPTGLTATGPITAMAGVEGFGADLAVFDYVMTDEQMRVLWETQRDRT